MSQATRDFVSAHAGELLDQLIDLVQVVAPDGTFLYVNRAWQKELGYTEEAALRLNFLDILHPDHQQPWIAIFRNVLDGQRLDNFDMVLVAKNGRQFAVDGSLWSWRREEGASPVGVGAVLRDSAARTIGETRVSRSLYKDELTGLFNRSGFVVRTTPFLELLADRVDRIRGWIAYLEIDNLAELERRHGPIVAEEAQKRTADVLNHALRGHDIIGRISNGVFAALVTLPLKYQPSYVLTRVRGALSLANRHAGPDKQVELAIGAADVDPVAGIDAALQRAREQALASSSRKRK